MLDEIQELAVSMHTGIQERDKFLDEIEVELKKNQGDLQEQGLFLQDMLDYCDEFIDKGPENMTTKTPAEIAAAAKDEVGDADVDAVVAAMLTTARTANDTSDDEYNGDPYGGGYGGGYGAASAACALGPSSPSERTLGAGDRTSRRRITAPKSGDEQQRSARKSIVGSLLSGNIAEAVQGVFEGAPLTDQQAEERAAAKKPQAERAEQPPAKGKTQEELDAEIAELERELAEIQEAEQEQALNEHAEEETLAEKAAFAQIAARKAAMGYYSYGYYGSGDSDGYEEGPVLAEADQDARRLREAAKKEKEAFKKRVEDAKAKRDAEKHRRALEREEWEREHSKQVAQHEAKRVAEEARLNEEKARKLEEYEERQRKWEEERSRKNEVEEEDTVLRLPALLPGGPPPMEGIALTCVIAAPTLPGESDEEFWLSDKEDGLPTAPLEKEKKRRTKKRDGGLGGVAEPGSIGRPSSGRKRRSRKRSQEDDGPSRSSAKSLAANFQTVAATTHLQRIPRVFKRPTDGSRRGSQPLLRAQTSSNGMLTAAAATSTAEAEAKAAADAQAAAKVKAEAEARAAAQAAKDAETRAAQAETEAEAEAARMEKELRRAEQKRQRALEAAEAKVRALEEAAVAAAQAQVEAETAAAAAAADAANAEAHARAEAAAVAAEAQAKAEVRASKEAQVAEAAEAEAKAEAAAAEERAKSAAETVAKAHAVEVEAVATKRAAEDKVAAMAGASRGSMREQSMWDGHQDVPRGLAWEFEQREQSNELGEHSCRLGLPSVATQLYEPRLVCYRGQQLTQPSSITFGFSKTTRSAMTKWLNEPVPGSYRLHGPVGPLAGARPPQDADSSWEKPMRRKRDVDSHTTMRLTRAGDGMRVAPPQDWFSTSIASTTADASDNREGGCPTPDYSRSDYDTQVSVATLTQACASSHRPAHTTPSATLPCLSRP